MLIYFLVRMKLSHWNLPNLRTGQRTNPWVSTDWVCTINCQTSHISRTSPHKNKRWRKSIDPQKTRLTGNIWPILKWPCKLWTNLQELLISRLEILPGCTRWLVIILVGWWAHAIIECRRLRPTIQRSRHQASKLIDIMVVWDLNHLTLLLNLMKRV